MKASSGDHYPALDHVRALAVMLVFSWHFMHGQDGHPVPFEGAPGWGPLVFFDEGHVGVAVFMTLSGYLFAKLLDGRQIHFGLFLWNRMLRLLPLLVLVLAINGLIQSIQSGSAFSVPSYLASLARGLVFPGLPNGGWSVTVEMHFYLLLPLLLALQRRSAWSLWLVLALSLAIRAVHHHLTGQVQTLAYFTLFGRIDQFVLGMIAFQNRDLLRKNHVAAALTLLAFSTLYWWFGLRGGFFRQPSYPSPTPLWIAMPTLEGLAVGILIGWYDQSFEHRMGRLSSAAALVGKYSYSIYLLHFFFVFDMAPWVHAHVADIADIPSALAAASLCFLLMIPLAHASFIWVESPFLGLRRRYIRQQGSAELGQREPGIG